jgi:TonB-dependent SusC/RagA subfamily outer membrane receptor
VQVSQALGDPGAAPVINIRGLGSIGAGNNPLFVVDGYPLNSADDFNNINPADIETIQVLKDAAAAAIYGSRGGNGIIIVTTKRGKAGTTKFNFTPTYLKK